MMWQEVVRGFLEDEDGPLVSAMMLCVGGFMLVYVWKTEWSSHIFYAIAIVAVGLFMWLYWTVKSWIKRVLYDMSHPDDEYYE